MLSTIAPYAAHPSTGRLLLGDFKEKVTLHPSFLDEGGFLEGGLSLLRMCACTYPYSDLLSFLCSITIML